MTTTTQRNTTAEFVFNVVLSVGAGFVDTSATSLAGIWKECHNNPELLRLAEMYLVGSSERAEIYKGRLVAKISEVFATELGGLF